MRFIDRAILWLTVATLSWGVLAFGAVYDWAYRPLLVGAMVCGVAAFLRRPGFGGSGTVGVATILTFIAIALQIVPVTRNTIRQLNPGLDAIHCRLTLFYCDGDPLTYTHPISVAPGSTTIGLIFFASASVLGIGLAKWLTRESLRRLSATFVVLGTVLAFVAVVQRAMSPGLIYGFWAPTWGTDPYGPFVNRNHFAGWMTMAIPVAVGYAIGLNARLPERNESNLRMALLRWSRPQYSSIALVIFASFAMILATMLSWSRSGIIALAAAGLGCALVTRRRNRLSTRGLLVGVAAVTIAIVWVGAGPLANRFQSLGEPGRESRFLMWAATWRMFQDASVTGVGIRAFATANLVYQPVIGGVPGSPLSSVQSAHNDWLQLLAEGGMLVSVPAASLVISIVVTMWRRFREHCARGDFGTTYWIRVGSVTGLCAIALQSLAEFSLQMPGNTITFAVLCAIAITPVRSERRAEESLSSREPLS